MNNIKTIFEDEYLIILDKSAGIHSSSIPSKNSLNSVAEFLREKYPETAQAAKKEEDSGLINRLDLDTSGCIIAAKNKEIWEKLRAYLKEGKIKKTYLALVEGKVQKNISLETGVGNPKRRAKKVKVYPDLDKVPKRVLVGKTDFEPISYDSSLNCSLVLTRAHSAKRHQIRAHSSHNGHPLIGDELYDAATKLEDFLNDEISRTFFLHAFSVEFPRKILEFTLVIR